MIRNQFFLTFIVFLVYLAKGWGEEPLFLSLKQAEDLAIQNNYQMNASLHRLEQGYYGYRASKNHFLPKVTLSSEINIGKEHSSNSHGLNSALLVTQPLYDRVAIYSLKEAQIEWECLRLQVQQQICDLLFQVRNAYYTVLLNQAHLVIDEMIIQLWGEEVKRQERHLELGASIPLELNQTQLHSKGAQIDYYSTQSDIRSSQIKLLTLLGLAPNTVIHLTEKEILLPLCQKYDLNQWKQWAAQYRPQLKQEQFAYFLSQNKLNQTKAERSPTLNLYASAGHRYINNGFDHQPSVGVGLNLDWTLYNPSLQHRIKQAQEGNQEAASNYYQIELETEAILSNLLNEIEKSYLSYLTAQEGEILAEEGMCMATKKHQLGLISSFEYRGAIKALHEAQQQVNQAKFDVRNAYNQLIQQVGLDLEQR